MTEYPRHLKNRARLRALESVRRGERRFGGPFGPKRDSLALVVIGNSDAKVLLKAAEKPRNN